MSHIFISYSQKDLVHAQEIVAALAAAKLDTWTDWKSIPKGEDWWKRIQSGIVEADAFLFLISPESAKSKICRDEIAYALKKRKRILPILIRDVSAEDVHDEVAKRNWIFCREGEDDFEAAIEKINIAVRTDYEWVSYHTKLLTKAQVWEDTKRESSRLLRGNELKEAEEQLRAAKNKEPEPDDLQRDYVQASRERQKRIRKTSLVAATVAVIALSFLAVFAANQRESAAANEQIDRALQIVSAAKSLNLVLDSNQIVANLLAVQSLKLFPNGDAASFLLNNHFNFDFITRFSDENIAAFHGAAFSPDGTYVVSYGDDATAHVWEAATGELVARLTHGEWVESVAYSPDGEYVITCSDDGTARVWETSTWQEIVRQTHNTGINNPATCSLAMSPDGMYVISSGQDGTMRVWETVSGNEVAHISHDDVTSVAFSPDGKHVLTGGSDGTARVWDARTGKELASMSHPEAVQAVAYSPDGNYVVSSSVDRTVRVWEPTAGKEVAHVNHTGWVQAVAFSPDGKYVVSGSRDGTALVWEATSGDEVARMSHDSGVNSVAFSPDGKYVVSASDDETARVWETITGREVARINHFGPVRVVAFSPDGSHVVSGSEDNTALVWVWRPEDLIANTCAIIPRNLSLSEWQQFVGPDVSYEVVCDPKLYPNAIIPPDAQQYLDVEK